MKIDTIRHSLAHIMAAAMQELFPGVKFGIGPTIENGFYYDFHVAGTLNEKDLQKIERRMREIIGRELKFIKRNYSLRKAKNLFLTLKQPYKSDILKKGTEDFDPKKEKSITTYQLGNFFDLCKGPHVRSTKQINPKSFKLTKVSGAYWRGAKKNPMLQRIYGIAFETPAELKDFLLREKNARERDHRKIGQALDLFSFNNIAPGTVFWHPKGMTIFRELENWWRQEHKKRGYFETSTPIMVKKKLFEKSGHCKHYQENMFGLEIEKESYILKPMNCPESTLIFSSKIRSYKDLPLRFSEIGLLHRNEPSGVLAGLFRVRQLTMDDAHIYCRADQIQDEVKNLLRFVKDFYKIFNFKPRFKLATRPSKFMGNIRLWRKAEKSLEYTLRQNKLSYEIKPKDGAFYGPKIDVHITDSLQRSWQMATLQLDFQTPECMNLNYVDEKGKKQKPVIIHRAIFGSFERFIAILLENYAGALPLWLAPEQIWIIPIGKKHWKYTDKVYSQFLNLNFRAILKKERETLSKKIRNGEIKKIPYLLVIGDKEVKNKSVRLRKRGKGDMGEIKLDKFIEKIQKEREVKKSR